MPSQHGVHLAMPDDEVLPKADDYDTSREFPTLASTLSRPRLCHRHGGQVASGQQRPPGKRLRSLGGAHQGPYHRLLREPGLRGRADPHRVGHPHRRPLHRPGHRVPERRPRREALVPPGQLRRSLRAAAHGGGSRHPQPVPIASPAGPSSRSRPSTSASSSLAVPFDFDVDPTRNTRSIRRSTTPGGRFGSTTIVPRGPTSPPRTLSSTRTPAGSSTPWRTQARTEDTLVIYTTDQGNPYGQRGLWGHPPWTDPPFMHDVTFNVPLIVRRPGTVRPNG